MEPLGASTRQTLNYKSVDFLAGRDTGLKEGITAAVAALRMELARTGCTDDEITRIVARVQAAAVSST
jgi:hypothetical protein